MIIVNNYKIVDHKNGKYIIIINAVKMLSPCCNEKLTVFSYRERYFINEDSVKKTILLRRYRCTKCGKTHTELPSFLCPYRLYCVDVIEKCIDSENAEECPVKETSTVYRIKNAFKNISNVWINTLFSIRAKFATDPVSDPTLEDLPIIDMSVIREKQGWLSRVVRALVNLNFGKYTKLAWNPGGK